MGFRIRPHTETHEPKVWVPEVLEKVAWRVKAADEPFRGVTSSSGLQTGLFSLEPTGVDVSGIRRAAERYLAALTPAQLDTGTFPVDHKTWRHWSNGARYFLRHGLLLEDLDQPSRDLALDVVRRCLSEAGYQQVLDMMHLNRTIGELRGEVDELNEWVYWFSVYGEPGSGAWGWQLDGHHANVNCMLVGDQMVLTPMFLGAEPVRADGGKFAGTHVFREEEFLGEHFFGSLTDAQRGRAVIADSMPEDLFVGQFRDNLELDPVGLRLGSLTDDQRAVFSRLLGQYTGRANPGHARVRFDEAMRHFDETRFAWIGDPDGVFYYRIHNPVILIEFDHQHGVLFDNDEPTRRHVHTLVRTPNGNDYGADLLRQHHERFDHSRGGHAERHEHTHSHADGSTHSHPHSHAHEHGHQHDHPERTNDDAR